MNEAPTCSQPGPRTEHDATDDVAQAKPSKKRLLLEGLLSIQPLNLDRMPTVRFWPGTGDSGRKYYHSNVWYPRCSEAKPTVGYRPNIGH